MGVTEAEAVRKEDFNAIGMTNQVINCKGLVYPLRIKRKYDGKYFQFEFLEVEGIISRTLFPKAPDQLRKNEAVLSAEQLEWKAPSLLLGIDNFWDIEPEVVMKLQSGFNLISTNLGMLVAGRGVLQLPYKNDPEFVINACFQHQFDDDREQELDLLVQKLFQPANWFGNPRR